MEQPSSGKTHTVSANETILSIAHTYGFRTWETIWDHETNQPLREARPDPTILAPGDKVFIPPKKQKKETAELEKTNTYWVKSLKARMKYVVRFESGKKLVNTLYRLVVEEKTFEGRTDADGVIDVEISPTARKGTLTVWYNEEDPEDMLTWEIAVGGMDPIDTITGVQARLNHLGFDAGPVTGSMNEETTAAIRAFQEFIGVAEPSGQPDADTLKALELLQNAK
ncbi:putative peptidoglycan binding domain protein [Phycisphaerae bacterium RAS1]|nr:putative peptidoglycan binding domain protein [Phycisphaerae bacterium RAS1]